MVLIPLSASEPIIPPPRSPMISESALVTVPTADSAVSAIFARAELLPASKKFNS